MPDFVIRHIDSLLAERILALAKKQQSSVNDVVLDALRHGLGMHTPGEDLAQTTFEGAGAVHLNHWNEAETEAFQEAMQALAMAKPPASAPIEERWGLPTRV